MHDLSTQSWNPWNWFNNEDMMRKQQRGGKMARNLRPMTPFSLFGPLSNFYRDIDRMFEETFGMPGMASSGISMLRDTFRPHINVATTEKEYIVTAEAPGINEKDLKLDLFDDGTLRIRGEKKQQEDKAHDMNRSESSYSFFERILTLPEDADREEISAGCENGLLTITLPRKESGKQQSRSIPIGASSGGRGSSGNSERQSQGERQSSESTRGSSAPATPRKAA